MTINSIEPSLIKALIASESSFHPEVDISAGKHGRARGLMQLTDDTISILGNYSGELTDHFVILEHEKLFDPSANICAGIRWLFRKKITASSKLGHTATWIEAVADYKGVLKQNNSRLMEIFQHHYLCITDGC